MPSTTDGTRGGTGKRAGMSDTIEVDKMKILGWIAVAAVAIGSLGPWVSVGPFTKSGTSGDGVLTLFLAALAAYCVYQLKVTSVLIAGLLVLAIGIYDTADVSSYTSSLFQASVGWGLIMVDAGAVGMLIWWFNMRSRYKRAAPTADADLPAADPPGPPAKG